MSKKSLPPLINLMILLFLAGSSSYSQTNLSSKIEPVYHGEESTALSIFDTNPESPDGRYLSFVLYPKIVQGGHRGTPVKARLMVKNRQTGKTQMISHVEVTNHNGANAVWAGNNLLAAQVDHLQNFEVFDVSTGNSVFGKIKGELGHKSFGNTLYFSRSNMRAAIASEGKPLFKAGETGIWRLDLTTGEMQQVVSQEAIVAAFTAQNPEINGNDVMILHVEPNPKGDKILFDYRHRKKPDDKRHKQLQGFVNADGTGIRWVPERPMHVVWYDHSSMLGVDTTDPDKKIYRYDLYGKKLEMLAGTACHLGASPDRQWYAGEAGYYQPEEDGFTRVYLYRKGQAEAVAMLSAWQNEKITWWWVAHVNPSFSADGQRLYFIRAVDGKEKFEAVCLDLQAAGLLSKN